MFCPDELESSDRGNKGHSVVVFIYGIGVYQHSNGKQYEIRTNDFTNPCIEYEFHFDFTENTYSLRQHITGSLAPTTIVGVWEVKRELVYGDLTAIFK